MLPENLGPAPQQTIDFSATGDGPIGLDETAVSRALNPLLSRFSACVSATTDDNGRGPHGHISVRMRVRNDGHPTAARVSSGGAGSDFVNCARRVAASARFRPFRGSDVLIGWGFDVD
jgi:hypothetical protein